MHKQDYTQRREAAAPGARPEGHRHQATLLLPVPTQDDVDGFITLYRERYGVDLEPARAHEILGGVMRFLYLSRRATRQAAELPLDERRPLV